MWNNIGLIKWKYASTDRFVTDFGLWLRRFVNPVWRRTLRLAIPQRIHIDRQYPLKKGVPYIFAASHSCIADAIVNMACIDRSAFMLVGTTEQLDHNPEFYAAWLNGIIYVDRLDPESRKQALDKMERVLKSGSSVILFPEGGWNNTENLPCQQLFAGPWLMACRTQCEVVPVALRHEYKARDVYLTFGRPMSLWRMEKADALEQLRDALATLNWELMEKHGTRLQRETLGSDCRIDYMRERRAEYYQVKWSRDVWEEELTSYYSKTLPPPPQKICGSLASVRLTTQNAKLLAPVLRDVIEDEKHDFKKYMHEHWKE